MSPKLEQIIEQALELNENERGELACRLIDSLDEPFDDAALVNEAWMKEIERRIKEIEDGSVELIPGDVVMKELKEKLNKINPRP